MDFRQELHRLTSCSEESIDIGTANERRSHRRSKTSELHKEERFREFEEWTKEFRSKVKERERKAVETGDSSSSVAK